MAARRLFIANLAAEAEWARQRIGRCAPVTSIARQKAAQMGLRFASLMRADDWLWLEARPQQQAVRELGCGHALHSRVVTGPMEAIGADFSQIIAWAETPTVLKLRQKRGKDVTEAFGRGYRVSAVVVEAAARLADRRTQHEIFEKQDCGRSGVQAVSSLDELLSHVENQSSAAPQSQTWVVKGLFSAAGRHRIVATARQLRSGVKRRGAARLLRTFGAVVCEPWLEREQDLCTHWVITDHGSERLSVHRQLIDPQGRFLKLDRSAELSHDDVLRLERIAGPICEACFACGYRGPLGIDAWTSRGQISISEINPRMTMGMLETAAPHQG